MITMLKMMHFFILFFCRPRCTGEILAAVIMVMQRGMNTEAGATQIPLATSD